MRHRNEIIAEALKRLERIAPYQLDCATLSNLVGGYLQDAGLSVRVVEGEADGLPIHYRLSVDGETVDPWAHYYGEAVTGFSATDEYPVYCLTSTPFEVKVWRAYYDREERGERR